MEREIDLLIEVQPVTDELMKMGYTGFFLPICVLCNEELSTFDITKHMEDI